MPRPTEDWARVFIANRLKVPIVGKRKSQQWHDVVRQLVNTLDHYDAMVAQFARIDEEDARKRRRRRKG